MFSRFRRIEERVGFAFSGGGARGAAQVGALKALTEAGIRPHLTAGTSAGAVNATWFALHPDRVDEMETIWLALRTRDIFPGSRVRMLMNLSRHGYIHAAEAWETFVRRHLGSARFEDTTIPCSVVAVRLSDGRRVVFESGVLADAVLASTAIPGVFPPYRIGEELYADGGVLEYVPIPTLLERNATCVYAIDCSCFALTPAVIGSVADRCARIGASAQVDRVTALPTARGVTIHRLRPTLPEIDDGRNFGRTAEFIAAGYADARRYLDRSSQQPQSENPPSEHVG